MQINLSNVMAPCFHGVHQSVLNHEYDVYRFKGGRGSTKSSFAAAEVYNLILKYPFACGAVFMKQSNRLRNGAFALYRETAIRMGIDKYFNFSLSPMEITYKPTNQKIIFSGLDDAQKTKGISTGNPDTYIAIAHFEEITDFFGVEELATARQSLFRGGDLSWTFETYNPPQNRHNWVNRDSLKDIPGRLVHHSDYRMVPPEWLGQAFYAEMRQTRWRSEDLYRWMYLGEATGTGGAVFNNIRDIILTPQLIETFDNYFNGQDYGFRPDPSAFTRWHYDSATDSLYAVAESVVKEKQMYEVAQDIIDKGFNDTYTVIDSARSDMYDAFANQGVLTQMMYKGRKGQLSRDFGIHWLQSRRNIYIDKRVTPYIYEEFISYEYQKDLKTGEFLSKTQTFNDHTIDSARYALSPHYQLFGDAA